MDEYTQYLITLYCTDAKELVKVAISMPGDDYNGVIRYLGEPVSQAYWHSQLPENIREAGPIVAIEEIFAIVANVDEVCKLPVAAAQHRAYCEGIGWAHADACATLDKGGDPRKTNCADMLPRAAKDLKF